VAVNNKKYLYIISVLAIAIVAGSSIDIYRAFTTGTLKTVKTGSIIVYANDPVFFVAYLVLDFIYFFGAIVGWLVIFKFDSITGILDKYFKNKYEKKK